MDSYQPIFDAVRSRISGGNIAEAVDRAIRDIGIGHYVQMAMQAWQEAAWEQVRPSVVFRPRIMQNGDAFIALLGDDLQSGVVGTGNTPHEAMQDFDRTWNAKQKNPNQRMNRDGK